MNGVVKGTERRYGYECRREKVGKGRKEVVGILKKFN